MIISRTPAYQPTEFALEVVLEKLELVIEGKEPDFWNKYSAGNIGYLIESFARTPAPGHFAPRFSRLEEQWRQHIMPALKAGFIQALEEQGFRFEPGNPMAVPPTSEVTRPSPAAILERGQALATRFAPDDERQRYWFLHAWKTCWSPL